jgi:hypothetical protein
MKEKTVLEVWRKRNNWGWKRKLTKQKTFVNCLRFYRRFGSVCDPNFNQKVHDAFAIMSYHTVPTGVGFNVVEDRFVTLFRIISKTKNPGHENAAYKTSSKDFFFEDLFM